MYRDLKGHAGGLKGNKYKEDVQEEQEWMSDQWSY